MSQQPGLNSNLTVGNRRLHVQTSFSDTNSTVICNIFQDGRILDSNEYSVPRSWDAARLHKKLEEIHHNTVKDIELLYFIAEKVRQVKHPISCNKLGLVFLKRGFVEEAVEFFKLAIETDPDFSEAYNNLGLAYLELSQPDQAEESFRKGLEKAKTYADLHLNLGRVYLEKEAFPEAINALERALELNANYFEANYYMGITLLTTLVKSVESGELPPSNVRLKRALHHLRRAAQLFKPFDNEAYKQAQTAIEAEDTESALKYFRNAFKQSQPKMDLTFDHEFYLKFMYGGKGKDNQFIGSYVEKLKEAIHNYPEYADLHNNLGIAYLIMCRNLFLKALDEFRQALKINPNFKKAEKNLKLAENDGKGFLILLRAILK